MLKKKISLFYMLAATVLGSLLTYWALRSPATKASDAQVAAVLAPAPGTPPCNYSVARINGYKYVHPVLSAEPECESKKFLPLKSEILKFIESQKSAGEIQGSSVYLKDLSQNEWMATNENELYHLGSLYKVVTLICFLKSAETNPALLDKEVVFVKNNKENPPAQTYQSKTIELGHSYKIRELLHYMIAYSDNNATMLLHHYMQIDVFTKIFTDIGLPKPDTHNPDYDLSVQDYSKFLKVLYDGGYLSINSSEYAISLLSDCDFKEGMVRGLPANVKVAHKFGEAGNSQMHELHESGIVYLDNRPYLLTIMTRGKNVSKLAEAISYISKLTYNYMAPTHS